MLHFSFLIFFLGTSYIYLTLLSRSEISEQNKRKQNICINLYRVCHNGHTILWCKRLEIREEDRWGHRKSLHSNNTLLTLDCEETNKWCLDWTVCVSETDIRKWKLSCVRELRKITVQSKCIVIWAQFTHSVLKEMLLECQYMVSLTWSPPVAVHVYMYPPTHEALRSHL